MQNSSLFSSFASSSSSPSSGKSFSSPIKKRPTEKTTDDVIFNHYLLIEEAGEVATKVVTRDGESKEVKFFSCVAYNYKSEKMKFEAWGQNAVEIQKHLKTCIEDKKCNFFRLKNNDDIPEDDAETLLWTEFEPISQYDKGFHTVYKLAPKMRKQGVDPKLKAKSFLSMVKWRDDYVLENGKPLTKYTSWSDTLPEYKFEDLFEVEEMDATNSNKKKSRLK